MMITRRIPMATRKDVTRASNEPSQFIRVMFGPPIIADGAGGADRTARALALLFSRELFPSTPGDLVHFQFTARQCIERGNLSKILLSKKTKTKQNHESSAFALPFSLPLVAGLVLICP